MNDDILHKAEALLGRLAALVEHGKERPNAVIFEVIDIREELLGMLPGLVAEIKHLRIENDNALSDLKHEEERMEVMHLRRYNELR